ncbi:hypothetical protein [Lachnobacterium bovis]|uniref:Uncharacterized protein n=1 Tax=Lachnobacterium bovis TaxID=140626 RepID=A0A1H9SZD2_9FIRM|nr:hypothetical protein [Lachnobacterium bovis]SER90251.1 hypothetical protein SAMN02910429_01438 [Lachnobacterium bovis]
MRNIHSKNNINQTLYVVLSYLILCVLFLLFTSFLKSKALYNSIFAYVIFVVFSCSLYNLLAKAFRKRTHYALFSELLKNPNSCERTGLQLNISQDILNITFPAFCENKNHAFYKNLSLTQFKSGYNTLCKLKCYLLSKKILYLKHKSINYLC